jgi:hypothetical protein
MFTHDYLEKVVIGLPQITKCGDTQDTVCAVLSHKYSPDKIKSLMNNDYCHPNWHIYLFNSDAGSINFDIQKRIMNILENYEFVSIEIAIGDLDHCFVLCLVENTICAIDSYIHIRLPCIYDFTNKLRLLNDLIKNPTLDLWNIIFDLQIDNTYNLMFDNIFLSYSYVDSSIKKSCYKDNKQIY